MKISLFIPCFVDQMMPSVGIAMVEVLERLGHDVDFPSAQTCCGQPAFNAGCHGESRDVAEHWLKCFADAKQIVVPSGSCAAMVRVYYRELFAGTRFEKTATELGARTWELSQFLTEVLEVEDVGAKFEARATVHDGCHGLRELGIHAAPRKLLSNVEGLELVEMGEARSCCGFGGTFSVKFPQISTAMAQVKCTSVLETEADVVISNDPSCLMQIDGYLTRQDSKVQCLHLAEVLAKR